MFKPATRPATPIRMLLSGPPGSGKTLTALRLACAIGRTAILDTSGAADWYAGAEIDGAAPLAFDGAPLAADAPISAIVSAIRSAEQAGYAVLVIDGLTPIYRSLRALVDAAPRPAEGWTRYNEAIRGLIAAIQSAKIHILLTMRTGVTMAPTLDEKGRPSTAPLGSDLTANDLGYEVDYWISMTGGVGRVHKSTPCPALTGSDVEHPGPALAQTIAEAHCSRATAPEAPQATHTPAPESPAGEAPVASGDGLPAQTSSPASIAEVRACIRVALNSGYAVFDEVLNVVRRHCTHDTTGKKLATVPASRADLDALLSALHDLGVPRG